MGNLEEFNIVNWSEFYKNFVQNINNFSSMFVTIPGNLKVLGEDEATEEFFTGILNKPEMMKYFAVLVRTDPSYSRLYSMDFSNPNRWLYFARLTDTSNPKVQQSWEILNKEVFHRPTANHIQTKNFNKK